MRPYLDKAVPESWRAAEAFAASVGQNAEERGLTRAELELINVRISQMNACGFCLDLHSRQARQAGVPQQKLDLLAAWREAGVFSEREEALLAVAEAGTRLPQSEELRADLVAAQQVLGDDVLAAAEWATVSINAFNRISILSEHPVRARDADGKVIRLRATE